MENLTPPANVQNRPGWSTASASRDAGTPTAGTVPALTMPTGTASRSAPPPAPGRTRRSRSNRQCRQKARAAAHHAPPPWPFSFAHLPAAGPAACPLHGSPAGSVRISDGPARSMTRRHPATAADHPAQLHRQPAADRPRQQHKRRTDDPAAHKLHSLHTLPALTAASSPPPAPTDTAPRQPCRPPAAADHPASAPKSPTAARRRRGQILYLTGIWPLQYSQ